MSERMILTITPKTVGVYGRDQDGAVWSSWFVTRATETCTICGATISHGYHRAFSNDHICADHVTIVTEPEASHE